MDLRVLRYFLCVAREQNISKAAEKLHITQPTLSRQLVELENELHTSLLLRSRGDRSIRLTEAGLLLRGRAEEILALADKTSAEFSQGFDSMNGDIFVGAGETEAIRLVADAANRLAMKNPHIVFHLFSGNAEAVMEKLDNGLVDFGILVGDVDTAKYNSFSLPVKDTWGVLMKKDAELANEEFITPEMLKAQPLLLSQQSLKNNEISGWFGVEMEQLNVVATYNLIYNASLFVEAGFGYAITIDKLVNTGGRDLAFRPLYPRLESKLSLVWNKYHRFSKAAELFMTEMRTIQRFSEIS